VDRLRAGRLPLSREYLTKTFKLRNDHVPARLLEGELKLKIRADSSTREVAVGNPKLRTMAIPAAS